MSKHVVAKGRSWHYISFWAPTNQAWDNLCVGEGVEGRERPTYSSLARGGAHLRNNSSHFCNALYFPGKFITIA